jgi:hypothetical protein
VASARRGLRSHGPGQAAGRRRRAAIPGFKLLIIRPKPSHGTVTSLVRFIMISLSRCRSVGGR